MTRFINLPSPSSQSCRIAVIGAGVVGTCIALALQKRGAAVTLLDRGEPGAACSYGNSGAISTASVAPLAMPGVLAALPKMLLDTNSPLRLSPTHLPAAAGWLARFVISAAPGRVEASARKLAALHGNAIALHEALTREVGVPELFLPRGHLHLYPDRAHFDKDAAAWQLRRRFGIAWTELDRAGILAHEPQVGPRYQFGVFLQDQATIRNPFRYVQAIAKTFAARGGHLRQADVRAIRASDGGRWALDLAEAGALAAGPSGNAFDHVVVAAGAWSKSLLSPLGVRVALESQRGYHAQFEGGSDVVSRTVVLTDHKIFITPMEAGLRVGGTVEIAGLAKPPDMRRAAVLERIARETFPALGGRPAEHWMGHRPCMPDSVPLVGAAAGHPGLWTAVGHGHLGLTDSVTSAEVIADGIFGPGPRA